MKYLFVFLVSVFCFLFLTSCDSSSQAASEQKIPQIDPARKAELKVLAEVTAAKKLAAEMAGKDLSRSELPAVHPEEIEYFDQRYYESRKAILQSQHPLLSQEDVVKLEERGYIVGKNVRKGDGSTTREIYQRDILSDLDQSSQEAILRGFDRGFAEAEISVQEKHGSSKELLQKAKHQKRK
jgi:hypothetical protein